MPGRPVCNMADCCQDCELIGDCEDRCYCIDAMKDQAAFDRQVNLQLLERKEGRR